jgi:hypothetical protein
MKCSRTENLPFETTDKNNAVLSKDSEWRFFCPVLIKEGKEKCLSFTSVM